ncbi:hypothetical protein MAL08_08905 [Leptospira noguchii]|uniref:structural cement protein Gp24 n=1 Tax=Leptospira noguchii TaxID=28182 RepID=UPI001FB5EA71|nr:hypothetical protein [Leptospira noguchii]UOG39360.1 hypothetical protein MAL08_08905 [Leptospira noguchii]
MNLRILLSFLTLFYIVIFGISYFEIIPSEFLQVFFPFGALCALIGAPVSDGGLYNEQPGLLGTSSRDSKDERKRGSVVSIGKLPFGSAVMLVSGGEGISVIGADAAQVSSNLRFDGVTSYSNSAGDLKNLSYDDGELCTFFDKGYVWVPCEEATTEFDTVRIRVVQEGTNVVGSFRKTAIPGKTAVITGVKFASNQNVGIAELSLVSGFYTITLDN